MKILSTKERLRRTDYFFQKTISLLLMINLFLVLMVAGENEENSTLFSIYTAITVFVLFGFIVFDIISTIKRLHDLNKKGTWYFANLIPLYNIFFGLGLIFERGTNGTNLYGTDPRLLGKENFKKNIFIKSVAIIILTISTITISHFKKQQDLKMTSIIIENPQINDFFIYELKDSTGFNYNIFRIDNIVGDSLIVTSANYAYRSEFDANKALDENKDSGSNFWGTKEKITIDALKYINISKAKRTKSRW